MACVSRFLHRIQVAMLLGVLSALSAGTAGAQTMLGLNKVELVQQYLGTASGGDGSAAYRKVTRAMARKAIADATDVGAAFLRVAISGTFPTQNGQRSDLDLWSRDAAAHWTIMDEMMADLAAHKLKVVPVFVWNLGQFPSIAGERVDALLKDETSRSWELLSKYVREFVERYRGTSTILFYELGNEFNVPVDLDLDKRCQTAKIVICGAKANIASEDVIAFSGRLAGLLRRLDPGRKISSGYAVPRPSADHLRRRPEWSGKGPDWTPDSIDDLTRNLAEMHQHVDIISVHLYPVEPNRRFGAGAGDEYRLVQIIKQAADKIGKPLFVGEFGDMDARNSQAGSFADRMLNQVINLKIPYAAMWGWELYIKNLYTSYDSVHTMSSLEPGSTDYLIERFKQTAARSGAAIKSRAAGDTVPPRVVLTWPVECAQIAKPETLFAVAGDDGGTAAERVEFWLNDRLIDKKGKAPYQATLDPAGIKPGEYTVSARAYDRAGNRSDYSSVVLVNRGKGASGTCAGAR